MLDQPRGVPFILNGHQLSQESHSAEPAGNRSCRSTRKCDVSAVPERDVNEEASRLVNDLTESEPVNGEDLLESEDLKRQLREAKERLKAESPKRKR